MKSYGYKKIIKDIKKKIILILFLVNKHICNKKYAYV